MKREEDITTYIDLDNTMLWHTKEQMDSQLWKTAPSILYSRLPNIPIIPSDWIILSSIQSKQEAKAKRKWAKDFFPNNKIILTRKPKYEAVNPKNNILIDDYKKNIQEWEEHGGIGYKFINHINSYPTDHMKYCRITSYSPFTIKDNKHNIMMSEMTLN